MNPLSVDLIPNLMFQNKGKYKYETKENEQYWMDTKVPFYINTEHETNKEGSGKENKLTTFQPYDNM